MPWFATRTQTRKVKPTREAGEGASATARAMSSADPQATATATVTAPAEDADLVALARRGDSEAFGRLAEKYAPRLLNVAFGLLGNEEDAWDATQEAFASAWKGLRFFRGDSSFYTWMRRIVTNHCLMMKRRKRGVQEIPLDEPIEHGEDESPREIADLSGSPESAFEAKMLKVQLDRGIRELPEVYRTTFWLREMEQMSYEEIAQALKINVGTVRSRLSTARKLLREKLVAMGAVLG